MKFAALISGVLLVGGSLAAYLLYGERAHGIAFVLTGFVGASLAWWAVEQQTKDSKNNRTGSN